MTARKKTTLSYIGGLIDADGYVALVKDSSRPNPVPTIKLEMTDFATIHWVHQKMNIGAIYSHKRANLKHNRTYLWRATNRQALKVAKTLEKFMRLKRKRMHEIIAFYEKKAL